MTTGGRRVLQRFAFVRSRVPANDHLVSRRERS